MPNETYLKSPRDFGLFKNAGKFSNFSNDIMKNIRKF